MKQSITIVDIYDGEISVEVPSWCRWMAVDANGALWFYKRKPTYSSKYDAWLETDTNVATMSDIAGNIKPPKDWKQELYTWS